MRRYSLRKRVLVTGDASFIGSHLCERLLAEGCTKSKIVLRPLTSDDPMLRQPDIALARKRLLWKLSTKLDSGLGSTIKYFSQQ